MIFLDFCILFFHLYTEIPWLGIQQMWNSSLVWAQVMEVQVAHVFTAALAWASGAAVAAIARESLELLGWILPVPVPSERTTVEKQHITSKRRSGAVDILVNFDNMPPRLDDTIVIHCFLCIWMLFLQSYRWSWMKSARALGGPIHIRPSNILQRNALYIYIYRHI